MITVAHDTTTQQPTIGQTYRLALADTITQARTTLPQALHSRLDRAVAIVHASGVVLHNDGTASVACQSQPGKFFCVNAGVCQCEDFQYRAPQHLCKHVLARHLSKRALKVAADRLANDGQPVTSETLTANPAEVLAPVEPQTPSAPLPEMPASVNVFLLINGHNVQLTLRDTDEHRLLKRLAEVCAQYPAATRR